MPSTTSTAWVRNAGRASGRPKMAAAPVAPIAPVISPPGRCAHRKMSPPTVPIASVSSVISALLRLGSDRAKDERICLTPSYGKSGAPKQMR